MSSAMRKKVMPLPSEVPHDLKMGEEWFKQGLCVVCGGKKKRKDEYHCDSCYDALFNSIFDYDDD